MSLQKKTALKKTAVKPAKYDLTTRMLVNELFDFAEAMQKRKDIAVSVFRPGPYITSGKLAKFPRLPKELASFFQFRNGFHFEWKFIDSDIGGCVRIPAASEWANPYSSWPSWPRPKDAADAIPEVLLLDETSAESGAWIVRHPQTGDERIVYVGDGSFLGGKLNVDNSLATTFADYLREGIESGFVHGWQNRLTGAWKSQPLERARVEGGIARYQAGRKPAKRASK